MRIVKAPAAGDYGEPDMRFEGQFVKTDHYMCPDRGLPAVPQGAICAESKSCTYDDSIL